MPENFRQFPLPRTPDAYDKKWVARLIQTLEQNLDEIQRSRTITYSEVERFTDSYWTDNLPIYRKVVPITQAFLNTDATAIAHNITSLNEILKAEGVFSVSDVVYSLPWTDLTNQSSYIVNGTNIVSVVDGSPSWGAIDYGHIFLEYTKS